MAHIHSQSTVPLCQFRQEKRGINVGWIQYTLAVKNTTHRPFYQNPDSMCTHSKYFVNNVLIWLHQPHIMYKVPIKIREYSTSEVSFIQNKWYPAQVKNSCQRWEAVT
jgi:hypothetical protein